MVPPLASSAYGNTHCLTVESIICDASLRSRINAEPASPLTTFFTGQPILMSIIAAPRSSLACGLGHLAR